MQCVADEEKFKNYYHKSHRYSVKHFKKQMDQYISLHPLEKPVPPVEPVKSAEEADKDTKRMRRTKRTDYQYPPRIDYQNPPDAPENKELIKSAGLYRNHDPPETRKVHIRPNNIRNPLVNKKPKKKSDEPLVWVLDNNK